MRALNCTSEKNACFVFLHTDTVFTLNFLEAQDSWMTEFPKDFGLGGTKFPRELGLSDRKIGGGGGGGGAEFAVTQAFILYQYSLFLDIYRDSLKNKLMH